MQREYGENGGVTRLPPLDPTVAQTRSAVRRVLAGQPPQPPQPLVLVALSGGADSLALAAATAFEASRAGVRAGAVVIDHGLQHGSARIAARAATQAEALGLDPVVVRRVSVTASGREADGPEAAARAARYEALEAIRRETGATMVLTAHTADDQAEQVLLALARGSGTRALAGIPERRGAIHRPFLAVTRETTVAACRAQGLEAWSDPHNRDRRYTRVRVRERVLPMMEEELGPGIAANLVRTAEIAREDADALDDLAAKMTVQARRPEKAGSALAVDALVALPAALLNRVIRREAAEVFGSGLSRAHTLAVAALVTDWRGQGPIQLPGGEVVRRSGALIFCSREGDRA